MLLERPFFLTNRDWYTTPEDEGLDDMFFPDGRGYHIWEDAPEKAKRSYEEFYNPSPMTDEGGSELCPPGMSVVY